MRDIHPLQAYREMNLRAKVKLVNAVITEVMKITVGHHGDLKTQNILLRLNRDGKWSEKLQICDYGAANNGDRNDNKYDIGLSI